jgi:hypothetical protein
MFRSYRTTKQFQGGLAVPDNFVAFHIHFIVKTAAKMLQVPDKINQNYPTTSS